MADEQSYNDEIKNTYNRQSSALANTLHQVVQAKEQEQTQQ
jgi:hypothetical protein